MKFFLLSLCLISSTISFSQDSFSEADAKSIIATFFEGFHEGDTLKMKSVISADLIMQTAFADQEGKNKVITEPIEGLLNAIANRPDSEASGQIWDERLLDYTVQIDGNLAHVWTPYEFWFNGVFHHCGANAFTLVKSDDGWRIIHLIDSRRKNGCQE